MQKLIYFFNLDRSIFKPRGFSSLAEIVLIMGILAIIFSIGVISLPRIQQSADVGAVTDTFLADFRDQQFKAMTGDTQLGTPADYYGIHFDTNSYTLFKDTWSPSDPENFTINLPPSIEVSTTFDYLGEKLIYFSKGSGEIANYNPEHTITFLDVSTKVQKTIHLDKSGAYSIN